MEPATIKRMKELQGFANLARFAAQLGVSRPTLCAALAGEKLHPGTRLMLLTRIREISAQGNNAQAVEAAV